MAVITMIGAGQMASALSFPARDNGHEVRLVGTMLDVDIINNLHTSGFHPTLQRQLPEGCRYFHLEEIEAAMNGVDLVIGGVSSFGVEWFAKEVLPRIPDSIPILNVTKGMIDLPDGSMQTYPHYYNEQVPGKTLLAVGGPCTSYELADRDPSSVCFCGWNTGALQFAKSLLGTSYYLISLSADVTGVECAVAMKNAYALGVTLAVGLAEKRDGKLHYNSQAALFGQSVREMRRLLALIGGGDDNIVYGAGDLYVTVFGGRTRKIGALLGQGFSYDEAMQQLAGVTLESVVISTRTARAVRALAAAGKTQLSYFPLLLHVDAILNQNAPVNIPWHAFETEML
jgi:glycerol-3-phosphate dehydrogenase (NAD(P)+)